MYKIAFILLLSLQYCFAQTTDSTYADKLGFPKGSRVLILHVDDAGMSYDSNEGVVQALTEGASSSCSVMMPCPWAPGFVHYLQQHQQVDAGLHLTLTAEWKDYRWPPVAGKEKVPGLTDKEGNLWPSVADVVAHASPDEVETEIRAQIDKATSMGFVPTHLDSHMGTLFASPEFFKRYVKTGIEKHIPIMLPGGNNVLIQKQTHAPDAMILQMRNVGKIVWAAGLPVLDDLHNFSYDWPIPAGLEKNDGKLRVFKTAKYIEALKSLKPGVTMMIMHCTATTEVFPYISNSGAIRRGDLLAMTDPAFKAALKKEGIIVTTWRELQQRREKIK